MKRRAGKKRLLLCAALLCAAAAVFLYAARYYPAEDAAREALASDEVLVAQTDYGWLFDGPSTDTVFVFYPGGKVEETAYAPLLHSLAGGGIDVCLVKMPLHLAVLDTNAADRILAGCAYRSCYIGGHSLGGAVAANYAAVHDLDGVILLAAYPTKTVDEPMLLLCGSEDGVVKRDRLAKSGRYGEVREVVIEGGNHAGFGNYGAQNGDNAPTISSEEQQRQTAEAILSWIREIEAAEQKTAETTVAGLIA